MEHCWSHLTCLMCILVRDFHSAEWSRVSPKRAAGSPESNPNILEYPIRFVNVKQQPSAIPKKNNKQPTKKNRNTTKPRKKH